MVVVGFLLHLLLFPLFLVSGLVVPWPVAGALIAAWVVLFAAAVVRRDRPGAVLAVPALALLVWAVVVIGGGALFGWSA